jgi:tetratricopeptide (TPR) repeat protein
MFDLSRTRRGRVACLVAMWCVAWPVLEAAAPVRVAAQVSSGAPSVKQGQEYYDQSRFDDAIGLLKDLAERGALTGPELQLARELLARSYVKKGYPVQAREMFKRILADNPAYRPDAIRVPPDEMAVFEGAKAEFDAGPGAPGTSEPKATPPSPAETDAPAPTLAPPPPGLSAKTSEKKPLYKRWYFLAGVVAVGGGAALLLGGGGNGGGEESTPLPGFPNHP